MKFIIRALQNKYVLFFITVLLATMFLYRNTLDAKFIFDINSWILRYQSLGYEGFRTCFGDKSMRWGYHLTNIALWKTFGLNPIGWYIFFMAMHCLNAVLLLYILDVVLYYLGVRHADKIAMISAVLWTFSPYHTETLVWGANSLYLVMHALQLAGIILFLKYCETPHWRGMADIFICFVLAMFTFEAFLVFPLILAVFYFVMHRAGVTEVSVKKFVMAIELPMLLLIAAYFLVNKWRIGSWVGHYGEASHLNTDIFLIIPNYLKYLLKLLYVPMWFSFAQRDAVYAILQNHKVVFVAIALAIALALIVVLYYRKLEAFSISTLVFLALFSISILPVVNMYFMYYKDIEQDRYVYIASTFFYPLLVLLIFYFSQRIGLALSALLICISFFGLSRYAASWANSGKVAQSLVRDFRWQGAPRVFMLMDADMYQGAYCMRSMPNSTLAEMLELHRGITINDSIHEVYQFNMNSLQDSCTYKIMNDSTLEVTLVAPGSWLWKNSFGAGNLDNVLFSAKLNEWVPAYTITFKDKKPGDVFIYQVKDKWKQVEGF